MTLRMLAYASVTGSPDSPLNHLFITTLNDQSKTNREMGMQGEGGVKKERTENWLILF